MALELNALYTTGLTITTPAHGLHGVFCCNAVVQYVFIDASFKQIISSLRSMAYIFDVSVEVV